ncbi:hypothetical protein M0R45_025854 [Rubus argutus]|uniref:Uncharacterized protein n=1 Tax=Rubus argutus TaxID=59490 RepID=A0AAW1WXM0_RUBAR
MPTRPLIRLRRYPILGCCRRAQPPSAHLAVPAAPFLRCNAVPDASKPCCSLLNCRRRKALPCPLPSTDQPLHLSAIDV